MHVMTARKCEKVVRGGSGFTRAQAYFSNSCHFRKSITTVYYKHLSSCTWQLVPLEDTNTSNTLGTGGRSIPCKTSRLRKNAKVHVSKGIQNILQKIRNRSKINLLIKDGIRDTPAKNLSTQWVSGGKMEYAIT